MTPTNKIYLLNRIWDIHKTKGYISDEDLIIVSKEFDISTTALEGVISFYHFFKRKPSGKFTIYLNNSILSYFNGYEEVKTAFENATNTKINSVDSSGTFGFYDTSCIGLSDKEPAALISFFPFINLTPEKVKRIIAELKNGRLPEEICDTIEENIQYTPQEGKRVLIRDFKPGIALQKLKGIAPADIIEMIKDSGLKGRGGAFFSTGLKWEFCSKSDGSPKYIVCNADEGEPGSFKDRFLLQQYPELVIEGMIIAAYAVSASNGIIYLRAEYFWLLPKIEKAIAHYRANGYLGKSITLLNDLNFDIRVQMGAGAYICGEETALLESLEGKRGEPRLKTFFPTDKGFLKKPTVINNVETFSTVTRIVEMGVDKYKNIGTPKSQGTKLLCVAGDCNHPGIYEIEWGIKVKELLKLCGAHDVSFIQLSGPSGELISMNEIERSISLEDLRCEGSVMIFNSSRDLFAVLRNYMQFFTHESCGLCTPCRAGNPQLLKMIEKLQQGNSTIRDIDLMVHWSHIIQNNSRCGLGNTSPNSILHAIKKFPNMIQLKLREDLNENAAFNLQKSISNYNQLTNENPIG